MNNIIEMPANGKEFDDAALAKMQATVRVQRSINLLLSLAFLTGLACAPAIIAWAWFTAL